MYGIVDRIHCLSWKYRNWVCFDICSFLMFFVSYRFILVDVEEVLMYVQFR